MGDDAYEALFETPAFAGLRIPALRVDVREALDEPYVARVDVAIPEASADAAALLHADGVVTFGRTGAPTRRVAGCVQTVEIGDDEAIGAIEAHTLATITVGPAFELLSFTRDSRIFQNQSVPDILEAVLGEALEPYGREVRVELDGAYAVREYCVQYRESVRAFAERLMQEEGIHYAFDHEGDVEVICLRDRNTRFRELPGASGGGLIRFVPRSAGLVDEAVIVAARRATRDTTTSVMVADGDWTRATIAFSGEARGDDARGRDRESYEHGLSRNAQLVEYDGSRFGSDDAAAQAAIRQEAYRTEAEVLEGVSGVESMAPGDVFTMEGHPTPGLDGEYATVAVRHLLAIEGSAADRTTSYENRFRAISAAIPHRPRRTRRKPFVPGAQTAVVTGPSGEEIHVDTHGRIKIQLHWDREAVGDERSSCFVRVQQRGWSGAGWGHWFVPRIGMEVVVRFIDGDPDRPIVTGAVYDGTNRTPYALPDERTQSTIRTDSSIGHGGYNEWRFEDAAGAEQVFVHAQRNYDEAVENDHTTVVHGHQSNEVDGDQTQTIHNDQTEQIDVDQDLTVGGDRSVHVGGDFDETVDGNETRDVGGAVTEGFGASETRSVGGDVDESIGAAETRTVGGAQSETIGGSQTRDVGAAAALTVAGALEQTVSGPITTNTPGAHTIVAAGGYNVTTPAKITLTAPGGAVFLAPGGYVQMDCFEKWIGGFHKNYSNFSFAVFADQLEAVDVQLGYTAAKLEIGGTVSSKEAYDLKKRATWLGLSGTKAKAAPESKTNGVTGNG